MMPTQIEMGFDDCLWSYARAIQVADHGPNLAREGLTIGLCSSAKMLKTFIMKFKNLVSSEQNINFNNYKYQPSIAQAKKMKTLTLPIQG